MTARLVGILSALGASLVLLAMVVIPRPPPREAIEACSPEDAAAQRGKRIFQRGEAAGRPVRGALARSAELTGRDAACAQCHGAAGEGNREGGVIVPSLRPERLSTGSEGGVEATVLGRAVREGRASGGRALRPPMPRYALDDASLADLTAYLRCLGRERDPGVSDDEVRVGAALPLSGPHAEIGAAVRDALEASFAEIVVGEGGGVFQRRIRLLVEDLAAAGGDTATKRLLARGVFALVASFAREDDSPDRGRGDGEVPWIVPLGAAPEGPVFRLYPDAHELARAAVAHLARAGGKRLFLVREGGAAGDRWAESAAAEALRRGLPAPRSHLVERGRVEAAAIVAAAEAGGADAVLIAGATAPPAVWIDVAERLPGATLSLYAPLGALGASAPSALGPRVVALHAGPMGVELGAAAAELAPVLRRHGVAPRHTALQAMAAVAARVLVEGLRRAGSPPTRYALVTALEGLRDFDTGLAPPISFGRNRRVALLGAHAITGVAPPLWIDLAP